MKILTPALALLASPTFAHEATHLHVHAEPASWGPVVAIFAVLAGLGLVARLIEARRT